MSQLVQVYVRLKPYSVTKDRLERLGHATDDIVREVAQELYDRPVQIDVLLESGTLRTVLTVAGSIVLGGYYIIGNYKSFKEGITEIVQDGKAFGEMVTSRFTKVAEASPHQVDTKSIRQKTPGKVQRLLTDVERLDEAARQTKGRYSEVGLSRVSKKLREVVKELDEDEAAGLASVLKFENLPPLEKWPDPIFRPEPDRAGVKPEGLDLNPNEDSAAKEREKRKKLRYHNLVVVDPKVSKAAPTRADENG